MGTLVNYIRWRGDISFKQSPFTQIDSVICGQLSYFDIGDAYVPGKRQTVAEAVNKQIALKGIDSTSLDPEDDAQEFIEAVAASKRFGNARILDYIDVFDADKDVQFAVLTLRLDDGSIIVAFRGTDDSFAGWREDFMISFTKVESQKMAYSYLSDFLKMHRNVIVCGHSKGGNLALFSTCYLSDRQLKKVKAIYLNDSPGLCEDVVSEDRVRRIDKIATMTMPADSIVGRIFEAKLSNKTIVKSKVAGPMAHSGYAWLIEDNDFVKEDEFSKISDLIHSLLEKFLANADLDRREEIVNNIFNTVKEAGYERLGDLKENGFSDLLNVFKSKIGENIASIQPKEMIANTVEEIKSKVLKSGKKDEE
ncbi:MAG: DUF2974 domain-containing protein [Firmicutes bacterium]|nr:DUF2974 domain-containing protein [Bacillota bacterium]